MKVQAFEDLWLIYMRLDEYRARQILVRRTECTLYISKFLHPSHSCHMGSQVGCGGRNGVQYQSIKSTPLFSAKADIRFCYMLKLEGGHIYFVSEKPRGLSST